MRTFFMYIRQRRVTLMVAALFFVIFFISFALYHLPLMAVIYPALLCIAAGCAYIALDYRRALRKHRFLMKIAENPSTEAGLPAVRGLDDEDYQIAITALREEQRRVCGRLERRYDDTVEYYTVWAHQIKTPISSMKLALQSEDSAFSRRMASELFRIEQYVGMAMAFLRLDSTSTDYVIREHDLDAIIRGELRKFSGEFIGRRLTLEYAPLNVTVLTDAKWLAFVIGQVLSNALKYTPSGRITITLGAPKTLCISDTGIGIAPEDLPRIFERGYTGCNGRLESGQRSSGIGLYLCRRICRKLGHGITAESEPGAGTTVRIDLESAKLEVE